MVKEDFVPHRTPQASGTGRMDETSCRTEASKKARAFMIDKTWLRLALPAALIILAGPAAWGAKRSIDLQHSTIKIRVFKSGLFSALGHEHEVEATVAQGEVDDDSKSSLVELRVQASNLRVLDPDLPPDKRAQVQETMQGPQVLDTAQFPEIHFESTEVQKEASNRWRVMGNLTLHGQTHAVRVDVTFRDGRYYGSATLKQTAFGIKPVTVAGGTVKVKDEVKVEFEIALAQ
jgi:polyisoprenoid-binding protein YceI